MTDDDDGNQEKRSRITPPRRSVSANVSRRLAKGTIGMVPIAGSVLSEFADALLPDPEAIERQRWEAEVGQSVEQIHDRLEKVSASYPSNRATISGVAASLAETLVRASVDGLHEEWQQLDKLAEELGVSNDDVSKASGDLEQFGVLERRRAINAAPRVRLTSEAFVQLDRQIMGWSTEDDARAVAIAILALSGTIRTSSLHEATGWPARRFNPAFGLILGFISGAVSKTNDAHYRTPYFAPNEADRARLRRLVENRA